MTITVSSVNPRTTISTTGSNPNAGSSTTHFNPNNLGNMNINQLIKLIMQLLASFQNVNPAPKPNPNPNPNPSGTKLPFTKVDPNKYANFINNWDNANKPVLSALIQNADQYNKVFSPAATMGNTKPYAPDSSLYNSKNLVVLGRVVDVPANGDQNAALNALQPSKVVQTGNTLDVYYNYSAPNASGSSYTIKAPLELEIPNGNYKQVNIYENGKKIEQLNVANGQWNNAGF